MHYPWHHTCPLSEAPQKEMSTAIPADYLSGLEPHQRPMLPGYDSGVILILLILFLAISANFRHYSRFLKTFIQNLLGERRQRSSIFTDTTVSESRIVASLILLATVSEAIIAFTSLIAANRISFDNGLSTLLMLIAVTVGYYIWQLLAYSVTGYAFANSDDRRQWIRSFNASQSLLGLALAVPAVIVLFNPEATTFVLYLAVILYILSRLLFIFKGFRLFYQNLFSLSYFILYLCALEMAPLVVIVRSLGIY